jgi:hypothetical protein
MNNYEEIKNINSLYLGERIERFENNPKFKTRIEEFRILTFEQRLEEYNWMNEFDDWISDELILTYEDGIRQLTRTEATQRFELALAKQICDNLEEDNE